MNQIPDPTRIQPPSSLRQDAAPLLMPLISVVIPTCRRAALLLSRALPSALGQTLRDIEIIVVVDGPDEQTQAALVGIADPRLRVLLLPTSVGGGEARNIGIRAARAEWIALLDDDDEWLPHKLEQQLRVAQASDGRPIVVSAWITRTPRMETTNLPRPQGLGEPLGDYMLARRTAGEDPLGLVSSVLLAGRDLMLDVPFRPDLSKHQDWDWLLRAASRSGVHLAVSPDIAAIWYYEEPRPTVSRVLNWRLSREWASGHLRRGTMSRRAFVGFLNSHVSTAAQLSGETRAALPLLLDLLRAGPRPFEVARFVIIWLLPLEVRRTLRAPFVRHRRGVRPLPPGHVQAEVLGGQMPPTTTLSARPLPTVEAAAGVRAVTLIDPLDTGHHISYAVVLARGLAQRGVQVSVIGSATLVAAVRAQVPEVRGEVLPLYAAGSAAYYQLSRRGRELVNVRFLRQALLQARHQGSQVAHLLYEDGFTQALLMARLALAGQLGRMRVRATLHWLYFLRDYRPAGSSSWNEALHLGLMWLLGRLDVRTMVHSRRLALQLQSRLPALPVDTVPYFAEPPSHNPQMQVSLRREVRERLRIEQHAVVSLAFGGTRHDKGLDVAIRALALLPAHYHLLVVGPARAFDAQSLRDLASQYGVAPRTHFVIEYVPDEDVESYFLAADCVVLPYRRIFAGQSGPLLMAGALGIPIVASDVGVLAETVREYSLGLLCEPEDPGALAKALRQLPLTGATPRTERFLEDHSPERFTQATLESYLPARRS